MKNHDSEQPSVSRELAFTGERFVQGAGVEITYDHLLRYEFAKQLVAGKEVLEIACGEGYGAAKLAEVARSVTAFDISQDAIAHASKKYGAIPSIRFAAAPALSFLAGCEAGSFDVVVAFEFIEHVDLSMQRAVLEEVRRVLRPDGQLVVSTPDRRVYSDATFFENEFHIREMDRHEFSTLLGETFSNTVLLEQGAITGDVVFVPGATDASVRQMGWTDAMRLLGDARPALSFDGTYMITVASNGSLDGLCLRSIVLIDPAKRLVGEHLVNARAEAERAKRSEAIAREEELRARQDERRASEELRKSELKVAELSERLTASGVSHGVVDRLLEQLAARQSELVELRRTAVLVDDLRTQVANLERSLEHERNSLEAAKKEFATIRLGFGVRSVFKTVARTRRALRESAR